MRKIWALEYDIYSQRGVAKAFSSLEGAQEWLRRAGYAQDPEDPDSWNHRDGAYGDVYTVNEIEIDPA